MKKINGGNTRVGNGNSNSLIKIINEGSLMGGDEVNSMNYQNDTNLNLLPHSMINKIISQPSQGNFSGSNKSLTGFNVQSPIKQLQPFFSKFEQMYKDEQIGSLIMSSGNQQNEMNGFSSFSSSYHGQQQFDPISVKTNGQSKRDLGVVEKIIGSYGFVKCYEKETRLFFHYSSYQPNPYSANADAILKIGDLVEFEETFDKRNGKPVAINLTKYLPSNEQLQSPSANGMNLKDLLVKKNPTSPSIKESNQYQQQYQDFMKMLNISNMAMQSPISNMLNKENIFENKINENLLGIIQNNKIQHNISTTNNINIFANMLNENGTSTKTEISNDQIEGSVAVAASKKSANYVTV